MRSAAEDVLFPYLAERVVFQPRAELLGVGSRERRGFAVSFDHHDVLGIEGVDERAGLRAEFGRASYSESSLIRVS